MARKKKKRTGRHQISGRIAGRFQQEWEHAERLVERGEWARAAEALEGLDRRYPGRREVLSSLAYVYHQLRNLPALQGALERLLQVDPNDPESTFNLAATYLSNGWLILASRTFQHFARRWPQHGHLEEAQTALGQLEKAVDHLLEDHTDVPRDEALERAGWLEELNSRLALGQFDRARQAAEKIIERHPGFLPALNGLSQIHWMQGELDAAIATVRRAIAADPNNVHAHANLVLYLLLKGDHEGARETAERLKPLEPAGFDAWTKKAEALTYLGDDEGVLATFEAAQPLDENQSPRGNGLLHHFAAVAHLRQGRAGAARRHWRQALRLAPDLQSARENLEDLHRPPGERHAPWPFALNHWLRREAIDAMMEEISDFQSRTGRRETDEAAALRDYLSRHPQVAALIPILLDRGDSLGREFALRLALRTRTPELLEALRDFALGQRGPDEMRTQAAQAVSEAGLQPAGPMRLWLQGEWHEVIPLGFEIHSEPDEDLPSRVRALATQALQVLREGEADRAERLLLKALEEAPDSLSLRNNLATAYQAQGRDEEAEALYRQVHGRDPDYFFARAALAQYALMRGDLEEADELMRPLLHRRRLHHSEFSVLCGVQIRLCLARDQVEGARSWLQMLEQACPDHPQIEGLEADVRRAENPLREGQ